MGQSTFPGLIGLGSFSQWPGITVIYPAHWTEHGPGWEDCISSNVEITWNSSCSSKDTEIKEATHGPAEARSLLLAVLASFFFYLPKTDGSSNFKNHMHMDDTSHPTHISPKDQIIFLLSLSVGFRACIEAFEWRDKIFITFTFSVYQHSEGSFILGWDEAGGETILFKCPGLNIV